MRGSLLDLGKRKCTKATNSPHLFQMYIMRQVLTTPCDKCPFLKKMAKGFTIQRLVELALQDMPCHKTCDIDDDNEDSFGEYVPTGKSVYCAGAMIFLAKRKGRFTYAFDDTKLNMQAPVR